MADPHDWNTWENYRHIHEACLETTQASGFLLDSEDLRFEFQPSERHPQMIYLRGSVPCQKGIVVEIEKQLETRTLGGRLEVRGVLYKYEAYRPGVRSGTVLRYDNLHADPAEFHRHTVDEAGRGRRTLLQREQMPVLSDFFAEVEQLAADLPD